jgi:hypothetical protein
MLESELRVCLDSLSGETGNGPNLTACALLTEEQEQYKKERRVLP